VVYWMGPIVAVTGTPGCGKTTLCKKFQFSVKSVRELAEEYDCIDEIDPLDGASPIDIEKLSKSIDWGASPLIVDGHLSHLLPVDAAIIVRCNPNVLQGRLESREYSSEKIQSNLESELIGLISSECLGMPHLELDPDIGINAMFEQSMQWITDGFIPQRPNEPIDWIELINGSD